MKQTRSWTTSEREWAWFPFPDVHFDPTWPSQPQPEPPSRCFLHMSRVFCADMLRICFNLPIRTSNIKPTGGSSGDTNYLKDVLSRGDHKIWTVLVEMPVFSSLTTSVLLLSVVVPTLGELTWGRTKFLFTFGDSYTTTGIVSSNRFHLALSHSSTASRFQHLSRCWFACPWICEPGH